MSKPPNDHETKHADEVRQALVPQYWNVILRDLARPDHGESKWSVSGKDRDEAIKNAKICVADATHPDPTNVEIVGVYRDNGQNN